MQKAGRNEPSGFSVVFYYFCIEESRLLFFLSGEHNVCENTENQCAGNRTDFYCTEAYYHSTYTCNKDDRSNKEVFVLVEVDCLEPLEA